MTYGLDTWCTDQIQTGRMASGVELVAQAIYRRLTTARGTLRDGDDGQVYGIDLSDFVGLVGADAAIDAIPDVIVAEVLKDDRVDTVDVSATIARDSAGLATITLEIACDLHDSDDAFTLSIGVSEVSVVLLGVSTST